MHSIGCCKREFPARRFVHKNSDNVFYYLDCCPRCQTSVFVAFADNNSIRKSGDTAMALYKALRPYYNEDLPIKEKVRLNFIPLKHYEAINKETQREMYANGDRTGRRFSSKVINKRIEGVA